MFLHNSQGVFKSSDNGIKWIKYGNNFIEATGLVSSDLGLRMTVNLKIVRDTLFAIVKNKSSSSKSKIEEYGAEGGTLYYKDGTWLIYYKELPGLEYYKTSKGLLYYLDKAGAKFNFNYSNSNGATWQLKSFNYEPRVLELNGKVYLFIPIHFLRFPTDQIILLRSYHLFSA